MSALTAPSMIGGMRKKMRTLNASVAADEVIQKYARCGFKNGYLYAWGSVSGLSHPCTAILGDGPFVDNKIDNTGGADGAKLCAVDFMAEKDLALWDNDETHPVVQATIGGTVYGVDDHTVSSDSGDGDAVGTAWLIHGSNAFGYRPGVWVEV